MKTYLYVCVLVLFSSLGVLASQSSEQNFVCPLGYYLNNDVCMPDAPPVCPVDLVLTQYGCLEKGPCPDGYASYVNTCIPSSNNQYGYSNPYTPYLNQYFSYSLNYPYGLNSYYPYSR